MSEYKTYIDFDDYPSNGIRETDLTGAILETVRPKKRKKTEDEKEEQRD